MEVSLRDPNQYADLEARIARITLALAGATDPVERQRLSHALVDVAKQLAMHESGAHVAHILLSSSYLPSYHLWHTVLHLLCTKIRQGACLVGRLRTVKDTPVASSRHCRR